MNKPCHRQFELKLPLRLRTSSKKLTALNLNVYRNLHYRSLTALKHKFQDHSKELLLKHAVPQLGRIQLRYEVFAKSQREFDIANVCCIVDKFFSDSLTHAGIIEDDNWKHLDNVSFGFGGFSTEEHVLVTITEIEPRKEKLMRILLDEEEIQTALETYVETLGIKGVTGVDLSSDEDGNVTAELLMGEAKPSTTRAPRKNKGGRPAGSKNKPKEPEEDVATPDENSDAGDDAGDAESEEGTASEDEADTPAKGRSSKNLFGDEETESSESSSPKAEEDDTPAPKAKRSSIFDQ